MIRRKESDQKARTETTVEQFLSLTKLANWSALDQVQK